MSAALARLIDAMTITINRRCMPQNKNEKTFRDIKTEYGFQ